MSGFFPSSVLVSKKPESVLAPKCGACCLYKQCHSPKMAISGKGRKKILIVGEAPGDEEDKTGKHFVGKSGKLLKRTLSAIGIDLRKDCWLTNSIICKPKDGSIPTDDQVEYCRANVLNVIKDKKPNVVILLGRPAVYSVIGHVWNKEIGKMETWQGWQIPSQDYNAWICPTFHPSFVLHSDENKKELAEKFFKEDLKAAVSLSDSKPWKKVPDYESQIEVITSDKKAAKIIRTMLNEKTSSACDYETNMLKPDSSKSRPVSFSICWGGKRTISFPLYGEAMEATKEYLRSKSGKIASNLKFEERWTLRHFGCRVKNWTWDTMIAAHLLDNRPSITSVKFQAFVLLGVSNYDDHIEPFLKAKGSNTPNKVVEEIDLHQLLTYGGMDSLVEYKVAETQTKLLGMKGRIK